MQEKELLKIKSLCEDSIRDFLQFNHNENKVFMPNEIFDDLHRKFNTLFPEDHEKNGAVGSHVAFTYSYVYFIAWLHRYCKYSDTWITTNGIKKCLRYSPTTKTIDFIIKKNGVLDDLGYTLTTTNYPIYWTFEDQDLQFVTVSDLDEVDKQYITQKLRNYKVKFPVKQFYRDRESYEEGIIDGAYYEVYNTHMIDFEVFMFCMGEKDLGCTGFYLYSYLKMMNDQFKNGFDVALADLTHQTKIKDRTLDKYLKSLKKYRMINCIHNQDYYVSGLSKEERKANTYQTNEYTFFSNEPVKVKNIESMRLQDYRKWKTEKEEINNRDIDGEVANLPFNF
ncbi:hypothetical protein [Bacillus sp. 2205SS5-2]|uniref:hypothetical protein n=1 Tax=Bacillus sp. 2205SS5-2 TaxID=3109031 RepID=UPI003007E742